MDLVMKAEDLEGLGGWSDDNSPLDVAKWRLGKSTPPITPPVVPKPQCNSTRDKRMAQGLVAVITTRAISLFGSHPFSWKIQVLGKIHPPGDPGCIDQIEFRDILR